MSDIEEDLKNQIKKVNQETLYNKLITRLQGRALVSRNMANKLYNFFKTINM